MSNNGSIMPGDRLPKLLKGSFEAALSRLSLKSDSGRDHVGEGRLKWSTDTGVAVRAETPGNFEMILGSSQLQVGKIVPRSEHLKLTARTQDGWRVEADNIVCYPILMTGQAVVAIWALDCHRASFSKKTRHLGNRIVGLVRPVERIIYTRSHQSAGIPSEKTRYYMDYLDFEASFGHVSIQKIADDAAVVLIEGVCDELGSEEAIESIRLALGFVEGKAVQVVGTHLFLDGMQRFKIWPRHRTTKNPLSNPFVPGTIFPGEHEEIVRRAASYFHTEQGRRLSDGLRMCWSVSDSYGTIKALVACSVLESMLKLVSGEVAMPGSSVEQREAQKELVEAMRSQESRYGLQFVNRVVGFAGSNESHLNPKALLNDWQKRGVLGISRDEVKAWDKIRQRVAHGRLLFNSPEISEWEDTFYMVDRIVNVINKIVLQEIGFEGVYFDHSEKRPKTFAPCDPALLRPSAGGVDPAATSPR